MFHNVFQSGYISVLYSLGSKPLQLWDKQVNEGHTKRVMDNDINSNVIELSGSNISKNYIICPFDPKQKLGIKLPHLVLIIKAISKYFSFEVTVIDSLKIERRFRASNYTVDNSCKKFYNYNAVTFRYWVEHSSFEHEKT
eukprot:UN11538